MVMLEVLHFQMASDGNGHSVDMVQVLLSVVAIMGAWRTG